MVIVRKIAGLIAGAAVIAAATTFVNAQEVPADTTAPRIAVNQEAKDAATKLDLLQQEIYIAEQQLTWLTLLQQ